MIFQISNLTRGYVHVSNQTLDWARIGIVSWVFLDEADCPMHAMPFWNTRVLVPPSWPGVDLNQIKIGNSARAHGLLPACIGLSDRYRSDKISKTNGCLTRLYTINDYSFGLQINDAFETTVALPLRWVVVSDKAQLAHHRIPMRIA